MLKLVGAPDSPSLALQFPRQPFDAKREVPQVCGPCNEDRRPIVSFASDIKLSKPY